MKKTKDDIKKLEDLRRLNALYRKYKTGMKAKYDIAPFQQPCLQLERTDGSIEFYDKAIAGVYTFEHTDETRRHITLKGQPKTMKFYNESIKIWTCHEDFPFQIPQNPLVDSELFTLSKDKDLNDTINYKAKELKAKGEMIKQIGVTIAILIGIIVLAKMLVPDLFTGNTAKQVIETAAPIVKENVSKLLNATRI